MSSHREAPEISKDPVADNTDTYAFISPDKPDTVTIISNYIPLEDPAGGPNFFEFGDDVLYRINVNNSGDVRADIVYELQPATDHDGDRGPGWQAPGAGPEPADPALQRRTALDAELPGACRRGDRRRR